MQRNKIFTVELLPAAQKDIDNLPPKTKSRITSKIIPLQEEPRPKSCAKLKGCGNIFRIRVGNYRILYRIFDIDKRVTIVKVAHRKEVYR
ncbi:MAG: type II toxin-antitoxin system RelE/ParE family toxin [candidate division Zixibacteria bacterium]|nr:type II toxin-antitoxin system RelE/ParE family toxin [Candidatus Tariuqbacter arcticus]